MGATVLVTGGTGQLGREVVAQLRARGDVARIASRAPRPEGVDASSWAQIDWQTGNGLDAALAGVDAVIHCASGSVRGERQTVTTLISAARRRIDATGTSPHLVYISIVGVDRLPMSYYNAKRATEVAFETSGLPCSILRATQFHSLVATFTRALTKLPLIAVIPKGITFQPIAVPTVATRLIEIAGGAAQGRVSDIGGPELTALPALTRQYLRSVGRTRRIVEVSLPGKFLAGLRAGYNTAPENSLPGPTFAEYLATVRAS